MCVCVCGQVCACVCACVRVCACACVCVCVRESGMKEARFGGVRRLVQKDWTGERSRQHTLERALVETRVLNSQPSIAR